MKALHSASYWYLNQLDQHGLAVVLTVQAAIILALSCTVGAALHIRHRPTVTRTPLVPAAPDNLPGRDVQLLWACRHIANPTSWREK